MGKSDHQAILNEMNEQLQIIVIPIQPTNSLKCTECSSTFSWASLPEHLKLYHPNIWDDMLNNFEQLSSKGYPIKDIIIDANLPFKRKQISKYFQEWIKQKRGE